MGSEGGGVMFVLFLGCSCDSSDFTFWIFVVFSDFVGDAENDDNIRPPKPSGDVSRV